LKKKTNQLSSVLGLLLLFLSTGFNLEVDWQLFERVIIDFVERSEE
jgi:hypothetical protein